MKLIHHRTFGQPAKIDASRTSPVFNPASGEQTAVLALAEVSDVDTAIASARVAFEGWRTTSLARRTKLMFRLRNVVEDNAKEIAKRLTAEHGKVTNDALGEVARGIENIEYACGIAELLKGSYNESASSGVDIYTVRQPLGVVAGITPFNFPVMVPLWMIPGAVACGNTFVLKPSEKDPSAPMLLAELFDEAGFPPGVLNVVNGDKVAVDRILEHPDVAAVSFVGSTDVARYVHRTASANGKRVQALGGAKNHMIVLPDADLDLAADAAVSAAYGSAGERCMAISVVVAVGSCADPLVEKIRSRAANLSIGDGFDPKSEMGPLITREHRDRVASYIDAGKEAGAKIVLDGRQTVFDNDGYFLGATLLDQVTPEMSVYRDEIFGPVLCRSSGSIATPKRSSCSTATPTATAPRSSPATAAPHGGSRRTPRSAWSESTSRSQSRSATTRSGGWKDSLFGDAHMYGPEGVRFFHSRQSNHQPLARSGREHGRSGLSTEQVVADNETIDRTRARLDSESPTFVFTMGGGPRREENPGPRGRAQPLSCWLAPR